MQGPRGGAGNVNSNVVTTEDIGQGPFTIPEEGTLTDFGREQMQVITEGLLFKTASVLFQTENTCKKNYLTDFHEIWPGGPSHKYHYLYRNIF